jgi:hypothetical protein
VRDGIELARRGIPSVALVTNEFWPQGDFVARAAGMPDLPRLELPHPIAGSGTAHMAAVADALAPRIVTALEGRS